MVSNSSRQDCWIFLVLADPLYYALRPLRQFRKTPLQWAGRWFALPGGDRTAPTEKLTSGLFANKVPTTANKRYGPNYILMVSTVFNGAHAFFQNFATAIPTKVAAAQWTGRRSSKSNQSSGARYQHDLNYLIIFSTTRRLST